MRDIMRERAWMVLLPVIATACLCALAFNAQSIDETEGKTADQILDESNGIISTPAYDTRFPATPQEARKIAESQSGTSSAPRTQHLSSLDSVNPKDARSLNAVGAGESASKESASGDEALEAAAQSAAGKWSISLSDYAADLTVYENQGMVIGVGTGTDGNSTRHITASGSISGDELRMDLVFYETIELYKLSMTVNGDSMRGRYIAYPTSGASWSGDASGSRSEA